MARCSCATLSFVDVVDNVVVVCFFVGFVLVVCGDDVERWRDVAILNLQPAADFRR